MSLIASIAVNVPDLPDNQIWFSNAASWNNYWSDITANVEFDGATTTVYTPVPYNNALTPYALNVDGVETVVPTLAMFTSLKTELQTLNAAFQLMRTEMRNAGYITNAQ